MAPLCLNVSSRWRCASGTGKLL